MTIDKDYVNYWASPSDTLPLKSFKTPTIKWRCDDLDTPCNPT
jgi:hypothetical protein